MIISRVPLRISFVGGGTDVPAFYQDSFGQVLSTTIDKYLYVAVKAQSEVVSHKYRLNWSQVEFCNSIDEIIHPIIRETFRLLTIDDPCEVTTFSDIPGQTGLGSSSAFAVGLFQSLYALREQRVSRDKLAELAIEIELDVLGRPIGKQDHYAASFGGMNVLSFVGVDSVQVNPVILSEQARAKFFGSLMLFYTGMTHDAGELLKEQFSNVDGKKASLREMRELVPVFHDALAEMKLDQLGALLKTNWALKKSLADSVSNPKIDSWYQKALTAGALGGKVLGAGGGGFLLFIVEKDLQDRVSTALRDLPLVRCKYEPFGATITYYDN